MIRIATPLALLCLLPAASPAAELPEFHAAALERCTPLTGTDFAFTSMIDGDGEIYLYEAASNNIAKLTDNDDQDHWATWAPDGRLLAFQSLRDGNREIYVKDVAAAIDVNISQHPGEDLLPSWSPDGRFIAFFSSREKPWSGEGPIEGHVYLMRADGSGVDKIAAGAFTSTTAIAWSRDSTTLFYARYAEGRQGIYAYDIARFEERKIHAVKGRFPGIASALPRGNTVDIYVDRKGGADVYQLQLRGGQKNRLTSGDGYHYYASWAPGSPVVLTTSATDDTGGDYDIRCVAVDGSYDVPVISDPSDARGAAWRPEDTSEWR